MWDVLCIISLPAVFYVAQVRQMNVLGAVRLLSIVSTVLYILYFAVVFHLVIKFHRAVSSSCIANTSIVGGTS
jgi:hypothetical protein